LVDGTGMATAASHMLEAESEFISAVDVAQ
jgi:hypothetical protein